MINEEREPLYDYSKLKGKIVEKYGTQKEFIKQIPMSEPTLIKKINCQSEFNQSDIEVFCSLLDIDCEEISIYFFTKKVRKNLI